LSCLAVDGGLVVSLDPRVRVELVDPTGQVRRLLELLTEGSRDVEELLAELRAGWPELTLGDLVAALTDLDELGWLDDAAAGGRLSEHERERYFSNLAFFDAFTDLHRHREDFQRRLTSARVVVLGAGGLGSAVLQSLAGLGVGSLLVVDQDTVELRNFARQFTYTMADLGLPKAEQVARWLRAFDGTGSVEWRHARIGGPDDVTALLPGADLLVSAIDQPPEVDLWVNRACVAAGVPFIRGGLSYLQGLYWSVQPGRSACRQCLEAHRSRATGPAVDDLSGEQLLRSSQVNRAIGPVAQLLGGLVSMEALRYLTAVTAPVSAGCYRLVDVGGPCSTSADPWPRDPGCPVCATAPARASRLVGDAPVAAR
jgi:molybdopterin/thiamine biosynthesis adenylyltransferase